MKNILIIKCGETLPQIKSKYGDFEDWIIRMSGLAPDNFRITNLPAGDALRHPDDFSATVISGSHFNTNQRFPWLKQLRNWVVTARYSNATVLGIGFGFQIIAEALGGKVNVNNDGPVLKTSFIHLSPAGKSDPLFYNIGNSFESYLNFARNVSFLPPEMEILAKNSSGIIMAAKINNIYGIQFHPEILEEVFKMYVKSSSLPISAHLGVKLKSEHKNWSILPNFFKFFQNL